MIVGVNRRTKRHKSDSKTSLLKPNSQSIAQKSRFLKRFMKNEHFNTKLLYPKHIKW